MRSGVNFRACYEDDPKEEEGFHPAQEDDLPDMDDPEWEECYATCLDARRRFGFYPVVALTDTNAAQQGVTWKKLMIHRGIEMTASSFKCSAWFMSVNWS